MDFIEQIFNYMCPAGNGVYTVHTASEHKNKIQNFLYGSNNPDIIWENWAQSIEHFANNPSPALIGIASDCGGGILRGANWGPLFIRQNLYQDENHSILFDLGDIRVIPHILHDKYLNKETITSCREALYNNSQIELPVSALSITEQFCHEFYKAFPQTPLLALGGDHSVSYPLTKEWIRSRRKQKKKIAIIHFDAHTDLLEKRLGIDICFGSWTYHILKELEFPSLVYQIGIRSSGRDKSHWQKTMGVNQLWSHEVREKGANKVAMELIQSLKRKKIDELYISFDIDCIDSQYVSATGTPEGNGLQPHEPMLILKELRNHFTISAADIVEVAPFLKTSNNHQTVEPYSTLSVAQSFVDFFSETFHGDY